MSWSKKSVSRSRARDRVEEAHGRLLGKLELRQHALAGIHQQPQVQGQRVSVGVGRLRARAAGVGEQAQLLAAVVLVDLEVLGQQALDELAIVVEDRHRQVDHREHRRRHALLCGCRDRQQGEHRDEAGEAR